MDVRHTEETLHQKRIRHAIKELKKRGIPSRISLDTMTDWLHNGRCSQSDYDLFYDVWGSAKFRFSLTASEQESAANRLGNLFDSSRTGG